MKKNHPRRKQKKSKLIPILYCIAVALLVLIIAMMLIIVNRRKDTPVKAPTSASTTAAMEAATTEPTVTTAAPTTEPTTVPTTEPPLVMLENMAELYEKNPDVIGYIKIEGTRLDYPVMYTPDDEEKYLRTSFEGNPSIAGVPFIDADCSVDPRSDNLLIYGHNMANGTAFNSLMNYQQKNYWQDHPTFTYSTLYEEKTYEIIAAFYDRVYYKYEDVFKFYQFIDAEDESHFNEAITYFKDKSVYDTGVTAEYGDKLITLITCAYHVDNGRFVVVGKEVPNPTE